MKNKKVTQLLAVTMAATVAVTSPAAPLMPAMTVYAESGLAEDLTEKNINKYFLLKELNCTYLESEGNAIDYKEPIKAAVKAVDSEATNLPPYTVTIKKVTV